MSRSRYELSSYRDASNVLARVGERMVRLTNHTALFAVDDPAGAYIEVRFHNQAIIRYRPDGSIQLWSNGENTPSWRRRIEQFTPFEFYKSWSIWIIRANGLLGDKAPKYVDGIRLYRRAFPQRGWEVRA